MRANFVVSSILLLLFGVPLTWAIGNAADNATSIGFTFSASY